MPFTNPVVVLLGIAAVVALLSAVVIIPENQRGAVVRLGRYFKTLRPGFNVRIPFLDSVTKVDLDASIPGWQTLSDRDLDTAIASYVTGETAATPRSSSGRAASPQGPAVGREAQALTSWLVKTASEQVGVDLSQDPMAMTRLTERATAALDELRSAQSCEINLPFLTADATGPKHFALSLTRSQAEQVLGSRLG